jgi:hypothetical protein
MDDNFAVIEFDVNDVLASGGDDPMLPSIPVMISSRR